MIRLDIDPEVEKLVVAAARARGVEPGQYAGKIVADALAYTSPKELSSDEFRLILDRLAARGKDLPRLPDSAYDRESIYRDHD
jgi:hypothetical protein